MSEIEYDRVVDVYDSDNVVSIAYSLDSKMMKVRFNTSAEYVYYKVTAQIFGSIVGSDNVGKMLYALVSSDPATFPYERIDV